jgi:hypothetical protein
VTVAELQALLSDLGKFLRAADSAKVAGELEYICARLTPFQGYKLKAFADFLVKAEEYSRGVLAAGKPSKAGKSKPDPAAIELACERVLHLYQRAIDPSVTLEQIEAAARTLQDLDPPKATLDDLAKRMGFAQKFKSKAEAVKAIRQKILGRKGEFDRVNA